MSDRIYNSAAIEGWYVEVRETWEGFWKGRNEHRYGRDFAAFVGERLISDFRLTKPEGENDTEQRPSTEAGDSDADTERSRSLGAGQISDRVGGRLIEEEK